MSKLILKEAILSHPHLDKPQQPQSDDPAAKPKYTAVLVLNEAQMEQVKAAALEVAIAKWGPEKGPKMVTIGGKYSTIRNDVEGKYPKGTYYISPKSESQPGLVYRQADPKTVTAENPKGKPANVEKEDIREVFYPGAIVNAALAVFAFEKKTNKGVGFALNHLQKWAEGTRLDGRAPADETFEADLSETPADLEAAGLV